MSLQDICCYKHSRYGPGVILRTFLSLKLDLLREKKNTLAGEDRESRCPEASALTPASPIAVLVQRAEKQRADKDREMLLSDCNAADASPRGPGLRPAQDTFKPTSMNDLWCGRMFVDI